MPGVSSWLRCRSVAPATLDNPHAKQELPQELPQALGKQKCREPLERIVKTVLCRVSAMFVESSVFEISAIPKIPTILPLFWCLPDFSNHDFRCWPHFGANIVSVIFVGSWLFKISAIPNIPPSLPVLWYISDLFSNHDFRLWLHLWAVVSAIFVDSWFSNPEIRSCLCVGVSPVIFKLRCSTVGSVCALAV